MKRLRLLFRGRTSIDGGCTYGAFTTDLAARQYAANISDRDKIDPRDMHIIDLDVDPDFVRVPTVVDNMGPQ